MGYLSLGKGFDFSIYNGMEGDAFLGAAIFKSIQENGLMGIWSNPRIGAPDTSTLLDFPACGMTMMLAIWVITWFVHQTSAIAYIYLIYTFVIDGISMAMLLNKLGIKKSYNFVFSALFAFAPAHFYRYMNHSSLTDYVSVPIAIYLCLVIIGYLENEDRWKVIACAILLGLGYGYYYAFGLILMATALSVRFVCDDDKLRAFRQAWSFLFVFVGIAISLAPQIIYSFLYGGNAEAGHRVFYEQEIYGLKIIQMLLPVSYSRIASLRELNYAYYSSGAPLINENNCASLGFIAVIGFIGLCVWLIVSIFKKKKGTELYDFLALSVLVLILTGVIGGFGEIFNWLVIAQIRCYNRSSIFIGGICLVAFALWLDHVTISKYLKKIYTFIISAAILLVGCFDQVNVCSSYWQHGDVETKQYIYEAYFSDVEEKLGDGAMVYQLPYMVFPEQGEVYNLKDYQHFVGYIFTDTLRWSYGGVRGRDTSAKDLYIDEGMSYEFLARIKDAGFDAVYINLDGYEDGGEKILDFYNNLGISPYVSEDGKLYTYDIRSLEVPDSWRIDGITFVKNYLDLHSVIYDDDDLVQVTQGLQESNEEVYEYLYNITNKVVEDMSDAEYIAYLYQNLLGREGSADEISAYVVQIESDEVTRSDVFWSFFRSEEFQGAL